MSRLTDLVARAKASAPRLGKELEDELQHLMKRQHFGLVFERHLPEAVELPNKPVRPRDKVRVLPPRGSKEKGDSTLWKVQRIVKTGAGRAAELVPPNDEDTELAILPEVVPLDDLVVVAEVTDTIYPGLVETGRVERGAAEDPYHTVINAENFHALEMLTYTHRHSIDAIYIDPPFTSTLGLSHESFRASPVIGIMNKSKRLGDFQECLRDPLSSPPRRFSPLKRTAQACA